MKILNTMYDTYGVESFDMAQRGQQCTVYYLNIGDSYGVTILYIRPKRGYSCYKIGTWADYAEKERKEAE